MRPRRAALAAALFLVACTSGDITRNATRNLLGSESGRISAVAGAVVQSAEDLRDQMAIQFSPEQEYYLGRGVAATAIAKYGLDPDEARQEYVRRIGATIVTLSPRVRATYGGWHFAVLASPEANGISGPGGFVMVTRGALDRARNEDEVAAVLAHEIAHVALKHGEAVIRQSGYWHAGFTAAFRVTGAAAGVGAREGNRLTGLFSDTVRGFSEDLASRGYGRDLETKADVEGTYLLYDAGYDAGSVASYLKTLPERPDTGWTAHPSGPERLAALAPLVERYGGPFDGGAGFAARLARFRAVTAK